MLLMWTNDISQDELLDPDQMIGTGEAARILGINGRTVRRQFDAGKIPGVKTQAGILFRRMNILRRREHSRDRAKFDGIIKTAYVFDEFGYLDFANYSWTMDGGIKDIESGLEAYRLERARIINPLGVKPADVFMVGEILARLNLSDSRVVYKMLSDGVLQPQDGYKKVGRGRCKGQRLLVTKKSFADYLGEDAPERFYSSRDLAEESGKPVRYVNRRVWTLNEQRNGNGIHPLGRKINGNRRNSGYLFTLGDICEFRGICGFY